MARGEGDSIIRSHFVERVVNLPMVHVAWDYATNTYTHLKESNKLVNFTLTNAEKSVTFMAGQAKPVVLKFEKQIQAFDNLACIGLGSLEEKVPFIKKPAEEIIGDTRKLYASTINSRLEGIKKLGNDTVKSAADFGFRQATSIFGVRMVQSVLSSVDGVLNMTQKYVDVILPPTKEEKQQNNVHEDSERTTLNRLTHITNSLRHRAYKSVLIKLEYVQEKSIDVFVIYPFTLVERTKTHLDSVLQHVNKLWIAIIQEESGEKEESTEQSRIEQQLLHLARLVSRQVVATYSSLVPLQSSSDDNQEPSQSPVVLTALKERVMWAFGMLKLLPQLLPMYAYGFASWLEELRKPKKVQKEVKENGEGTKDNSHIHSNNEQKKVDYSLSNSDHHSDSSIPEEDEM